MKFLIVSVYCRLPSAADEDHSLRGISFFFRAGEVEVWSLRLAATFSWQQWSSAAGWNALRASSFSSTFCSG